MELKIFKANFLIVLKILIKIYLLIYFLAIQLKFLGSVVFIIRKYLQEVDLKKSNQKNYDQNTKKNNIYIFLFFYKKNLFPTS